MPGGRDANGDGPIPLGFPPSLGQGVLVLQHLNAKGTEEPGSRRIGDRTCCITAKPFYQGILSFKFSCNPLHGLVYVATAVECRNPEVAFSSGSKARSWSTDHEAILQQLIKKVPTG